MTIIRVPVSVEVSPHTGEQIKLDTDTQTFFDDARNEWDASDLAASRPSNRLKAWLDENYPEKD